MSLLQIIKMRSAVSILDLRKNRPLLSTRMMHLTIPMLEELMTVLFGALQFLEGMI